MIMQITVNERKTQNESEGKEFVWSVLLYTVNIRGKAYARDTRWYTMRTCSNIPVKNTDESSKLPQVSDLHFLRFEISPELTVSRFKVESGRVQVDI